MPKSNRLAITLIVTAILSGCEMENGSPPSKHAEERTAEKALSRENGISTSYDSREVADMPAAVPFNDEQRSYVTALFSAVSEIIEGNVKLEFEEGRILGRGLFFWPKHPTRPIKTLRYYPSDNFRMRGISLSLERASEHDPWTKGGLAIHPRNFPSGVFSMHLPSSIFDDFRLIRVAREQRPDESIHSPIIFYFEHKRLRGVALKVESRDDVVKAYDGYPASFHALQITRKQVDEVYGQQQNRFAARAPTRSPLEANAMFDDKLFQQVPLDTNEQTACSPTEPGVDWRGVIVRAPSQVILPDQRTKDSTLIVPLCGLYFVDVVSALRHPGHRVLVVTDDKTGHVYRGEIVQKEHQSTIPPPPSPSLDPAMYADQAYGSYFNINVASYVALPVHPARYRVRVEYAGHQSNEVRIAVIDRRQK